MNRRWLVLLVLTACGDGASVNPDAHPGVDGRARDAGDVDAPPSSDCDYTEQADATNDTLADGLPEMSGLSLTAAPTKICGSFASNHFDGDLTVDNDAYRITVPTELDFMMRLIGNAAPVEYAGVDIYGGASFTTLVATITWYGDHGVGAAHLVAGTYEVVPFAWSSSAIMSKIPYTVEFIGDAPAARCPEVTTGGYAEAYDGAANTGNDVYTVPRGAPIGHTAASTDAAEPTVITLSPLTMTRVTGSLADVAVADQYEDRDAYVFMTGAGTNELTVRTTWTTATNVDFFLFEGGFLTPEFRAIQASTAGVELRTYSIKPNTGYTLLVAGKLDGVFPTTYTASLCGVDYP